MYIENDKYGPTYPSLYVWIFDVYGQFNMFSPVDKLHSLPVIPSIPSQIGVSLDHGQQIFKNWPRFVLYHDVINLHCLADHEPRQYRFVVQQCSRPSFIILLRIN